MTARSWSEGDPEPADHPPLVDKDGVTWLWDDTDEFDTPSYQQQIFKHLPRPDGGPGAILGGPRGLEWWEILGDYGPLREATTDESGLITEVWQR